MDIVLSNWNVTFSVIRTQFNNYDGIYIVHRIRDRAVIRGNKCYTSLPGIYRCPSICNDDFNQ